MTEQEDKAQEEVFLQEAPVIIQLTKDPRWSLLLNWVEGELTIKRGMYDKAQDWETIRQIQGVVQGLLFIKVLPERLQSKLDDIKQRDSKDSQEED